MPRGITAFAPHRHPPRPAGPELTYAPHVPTPSTGQSKLAVLGDGAFRRVLAAQSVSFMGDALANVALAFALIELGGSAGALGLVFSAKSLALLGCLLAGGVLADRYSRLGLLISMDAVRVMSQGGIAWLLLDGASSVWSIAALSALTGAATGLSQPAYPGLLTAMVQPALLQPANALVSLGYSLGRLSGPILGGLLAAHFGSGWALLADAGTFAVSGLLLWRLPLPAAPLPSRRSLLEDLREGWLAFRSRRWLWVFVAWLSYFNLLYGCWTILGPLAAARDLGGASAWGLIISAQGAGGIVGGILALRLAPRRPLLFAAAVLAGFYLPLALLAARMPVELVAAGALLAEIGLMLSSTVWETTLQRHVEPALLSRVSAYKRLGPSALQPVGLALWGPLATAVSLDGALWLAFALQLLGALAVLMVGAVRQLPAHPSPASREH